MLVAVAQPGRMMPPMEIDPAGSYVYRLWAAKDDEHPLYIGVTTNILGRLGTHMINAEKRALVTWVTFERYPNLGLAQAAEREMIAKHSPRFNGSWGAPSPQAALRNKQARALRQARDREDPGWRSRTGQQHGGLPYLQLAALLRQQIEDGDYGAGPIPSIQQIRQRTSLSVMTIRKAVKLLEDEGKVRIIPGRGTFPAIAC